MPTVFQRLGSYEILEEIGRGGMASVFLATDTRAARQVALRLVPTREASDILEAEKWGAELQEQFCRVSAYVPKLFEHGTHDGYFYVAMEYLDGENLADTIRRGPIPIERATTIAVELCRFLEEAHRFEAVVRGRKLQSLLHGDLTPRNVRITSDSQTKVLDFGIAKALSLSRKVTRNDFGSLAYLSPERLESGDVDGSDGIWAVGVMLYEMVSGERPFRAPDTRRLEQQIVARHPPPTLDGRCPIGLRAIIARLLAPTATDRYGTAGAIREDLERFTSGQQTEAERLGWPDRAADEPPTRRTRPAEPAGETTRLTRKPDVAAGVSAPRSVETPGAFKTPARWQRRFLAALMFIVFAIVSNEIWVGTAARRLAVTVPPLELAGLADVWNEYEALSRRSYLRIGLMGLERTLTQQTAILADRVIGNYRTPLPTVRETQWKMAREALARAVPLAPGNRQLRAALRYCEGHLHRINGEARKAEARRTRKPDSTSQYELAEAVIAFREAAELRPNWPDPFLGLARTFIYGLEDVDRGADALKQAQSFGYTPGERETVQLADGYSGRGETLARIARKLADTPQEQEYLIRAADAYRQALALYAKVINFGNVAANIRTVQRHLSQLEQRLGDLSAATEIQPASPQAQQ
jgi:Ser/Thr protein kinase RdoA (MazF antagonist)